MNKEEWFNLIKATALAMPLVALAYMGRNSGEARTGVQDKERQIHEYLLGKNPADNSSITTNFYEGKMMHGITASMTNGKPLLILEHGIIRGERNLFHSSLQGRLDEYRISKPEGAAMGTNGKTKTVYHSVRIKFPDSFFPIYTNELVHDYKLLNLETNALKKY